MIFNPKNKTINLVFTSAGDNTKFYKHWLGRNRNFNLMVVYYGNEKNKFKNKCDYYYERKGSKFQNLKYVYDRYKFIFQQYENFFILDDDIIISTKEINKLFEIIKKYDLWILGPSFKYPSKVSHIITKKLENNFLRYTNFVEVNVPLFSKYAFHKYMNYYNSILVGYGVDYHYIWILGLDKKNKYAICDSISCINPITEVRSINLLQDFDTRVYTWYKFMKDNKIRIKNHKVYKLLKYDQ